MIWDSGMVARFKGYWQKFRARQQPKSITALLTRAAQRYPTKPAIICDDQQLTFAELHSQTRQLAHGLATLNIKAGDWVGLMLPNCPQFVVSFLALAHLGAVIAPFDIYYGQPELQQLFQTTQIQTVITNSQFLSQLESSCNPLQLILTDAPPQPYLTFSQLMSQPQVTRAVSPPVDLQRPLLYLYTSGTTGLPKAILLDQARVLGIGRAWRARFRIQANDACYTLAPLFRSPALLSVLVAGIYYGITMIIPSTFRPKQVWDDLITMQVSFFHACPFHFAALAEIPLPQNKALPSFELCYASGNRLPPSLAQRFKTKFNLCISEGYGTSEVGGICRNGYPLSEVKLKIVDGQGQSLPIGHQGEIVVKTPFMVTEYYQQPDLSKQVFKGGWFYTGDIGKITAEGQLKILWRKKTELLVQGQLVYADEVVRVLRQHPQVKAAKVIVTPNNHLKAIVVLNKSCSLDAIQAFCYTNLASYKVPTLIEERDELPRSWKTVVNGLHQAYPRWGDA